MKTRVLIPTDGSQLSLRIVPAVERFFPPDRAELLLLHVAPHAEAQGTGQAALLHDPVTEPLAVQHMRDRDVELGRHPIYANQTESNLRAELEVALRPVVDAFHQQGYGVETRIEFGEAARTILNSAQQCNADVIAMATHGRTGLRRQLFGSVAENVLRHATKPVLVIHPAEPETQDL